LASVRLALLAALLAAPASAADGAPVHTIYATQPGGYAYDADAFGGNPFASALIWALGHPGPGQVERLEARTGEYSGGYQVADGLAVPAEVGLNPAPGEAAVALVVVFSDYGDQEGLASLPGAAFDAARIAAALEAAGYATRMVIARDARGYRAELAGFAERSRGAERALLYTTGHGTEPAGGPPSMLPPDLDRVPDPPLSEAIALDEVGRALRARKVNLLLYAGCRERGLPSAAPRVRN